VRCKNNFQVSRILAGEVVEWIGYIYARQVIT